MRKRLILFMFIHIALLYHHQMPIEGQLSIFYLLVSMDHLNLAYTELLQNLILIIKWLRQTLPLKLMNDYMKKNLIIALFIILVLFFVATPVEAHFLASDRNIGAVLHVDPNDQPIAGSQTSFFFEFKDKQNKFKAENCDCTFAIDEN